MNLDPVRDALLADARRDADEAYAAAERDANAQLHDARRASDRLLTRARAAGESDARAAVAEELARARREAREVVLVARREADDSMRSAAQQAVQQLRRAPDYPALIDGLTRLARGQLGERATVAIDEVVGGVVATAGSRSVDYRLPEIAQRCLDSPTRELEAAWR